MNAGLTLLGNTVAMALRALARNRMRSALTMLGVVIGVAAVIALVTLGKSATLHVTEEVEGLGNNLLWVESGGPSRQGRRLTAAPLHSDDARAIERGIAGVRLVAPTASRTLRAVHGNTSRVTRVIGTTNAYFDARRYEVVGGRSFSDAELSGGKPVCIIGETVRKDLFGAIDPVGKAIRVGTNSCRVVGRLVSKGPSTVTNDQDDMLIMPLASFQRRIAGNRDLSVIFISAHEGRSTSLVAHQISMLMRERRGIGPGDDDDFRVKDLREASQMVQTVTGVLTALLGAIAAVSLLVGGIGIMNIMLVSVTERTREIGIRLAIGARGHEVMLQFLVEAVALASAGGIVGMGLGLLGSWGATAALGLPLVVLPQIIVIAFVFSAFVGVVFGFVPARNAARLHPIEALRHE